MIKQLQTSRTCPACGQKKPLVAFLKSTGDKGPIYGDLCSSCRGSRRDQTRSNGDDSDESSGGGGSTRLQIDNKTRIQLDREKNKQLKKTMELDYEEKIKKEGLGEKKTNETEQRKTVERENREAYLEHVQPASDKKAKTEAVSPTKESQITEEKNHYQKKTRITNEFHNQAQEQQVGKKTQGLTPDYINRYVSATGGRSAESLFGRLLGQILGGHYRDKKKSASISTGDKPSTEFKSIPEAKAESKSAQKENNRQASQEENIAIEFAQNNLKKR